MIESRSDIVTFPEEQSWLAPKLCWYEGSA